MQHKLPSVTALVVAMSRALATHDPELSRACRDPYAELLVTPALSLLVRAAAAVGPLDATLRTLSLGLCDHVALRTALIDRALVRALEDGPAQIVLLGAGLDARAHRLEALSGSDVYEVDHPRTQRYKRDRAARLPSAARTLRYVACDLAKDRLDPALTAMGYDPTRRSLWIWEGVTMYLTPDAVAETLATIARLSAPESLLVTTYLTPDLIMAGERLGRVVSKLLGLAAEPLRSTYDPSQLAALLERAQFRLLSDVAPKDAAAFFDVEVRRPASLMPSERIAVSLKASFSS